MKLTPGNWRGYEMFRIAALVQLLSISASHSHQDDSISRSMGTMPMSKGGWRPVIGNSGLQSYSLVGTQNLQPKYRAPLVLGDSFSSSSRPLVTRDAAKLTSIAQSYKPTNMFNPTGVNLNAPVSSYLNPFALSGNSFKFAQNLPAESMIIRHPPPLMYGHPHRPMINKYQAQVALNNRFKQNQLQQAMMQQLAANHYHQAGLNLFPGNVKKPYDIYQKPIEVYAKPVEGYVKPVDTYPRPTESHKKPEYKVQDNAGSSQTLGNKQVKSPVSAAAPPLYQHQHFTFKDEQFAPLPPSILGSFTSFGHQTVKGRDPTYPTYPTTKHTYLPPAPTKQTIFNSFNYTPAPKPKEQKFPPSTTKPSVTSGNIIYGLSDNGFKTILPPAVQYKPIHDHQKDSVFNSNKKYPKDNFKPSPQDPLSKPKPQQSLPSTGKPQDFKNTAQKYYYETDSKGSPQDLSTYFPTAPTTTVVTHEYDMQSTKTVPESLLAQLLPPYTTTSTFHGNKQNNEFDSNKDKYLTSEVNPPKYVLQDEKYIPQSDQLVPDTTPKNVPFRATYEVTETWGTGEENTQPWFNNDSPQSFQSYNTILRPESPPPSPYPTAPVQSQSTPKKPAASKQPQYDISTVYSIDSYGNNHADTISQNGNNLYYNTNVESQSMRPVGDEYVAPTVYKKEKHKKHENVRVNTTPTYIERVTQPSYDSGNYRPKSKKKQPNVNIEEHTTKAYIDFNEDPEMTTARYETYKDNTHETENDLHVETLPTIPPTKHFKRPSTIQGTDTERDRYRKRNKNRRRRPPVRDEPYTEPERPKQKPRPTAATAPIDNYPTESMSDEGSLITRPRIRIPIYKKPKPTKPTISTELTNSAQPTVSPTPATINIKKKNLNRPRTTTVPSVEENVSATTSQYNYDDSTGKESSIMKIANRQPSVKDTTFSYDYNYNETPDYSHKQDEKDTPTSDIAVSTSGNHDFSAQKLQTTDNINRVKNISYVSNAVPLDSRPEPSIPIHTENPFTTLSTNEEHISENKSSKRGNLNVKTDTDLDENDAEEHKDDVTTVATDETNKLIRPRVKGSKYDTNRPRFSVKDYRNRLNQHSTSTTTEKSTDNNSAKFRFPSRRLPYISNKDVVSDSKLASSEPEGSTELPRKKFTPKEPRHKSVSTDAILSEAMTTERNFINTRTPLRQRISTVASENEVTERTPTRARGGIRLRPKTTSTTETPKDNISDQSESFISSNINSYTKRPRKKLKEPSVEKLNDTIYDTPETATESIRKYKNDLKEEPNSEKQKSETSIMKIAKDEKKHQGLEDSLENASEQSKRVADLTLAASKDYNTPGMFKAVSPNSRRVPNYFTIATDDPILPIEAFFPQLNQKKET